MMKETWHKFTYSIWPIVLYFVVFVAVFDYILFHFHLCEILLFILLPILLLKLIFRILAAVFK